MASQCADGFNVGVNPGAPTGVVAGANGMMVHSIRAGTITAAGTVSDKQRMTMTPVLYRLSTGKFTPLPKANLSIWAGNAHGWIVGESGPFGIPTVYTPTTGNVRLPTLVPHSTSFPSSGIATTISDNGLIIGGQDIDAKNVIHAVGWTCH